MAGSEIQRLRDWFYRCDCPVGPVEFDQLLQQAAVQSLAKTVIDAESFVSASAHRLINKLAELADEDVRVGRIPLFRVIDSASRSIELHPKVDSLAGRQRAIALRHRHRSACLREIDLLDERQYEALGCVMSLLCGADERLLTPPGNEAGVDFFARFRQPAGNHIFGKTNAPIRIVGQSKKYQTRVSVDRVKEFAFTIETIRMRNPTAERNVPAWFRAVSGPVVGWMVAHSGFQSGAQQVASDHGIVLSTSLDAAELISQSKLSPIATVNAFSGSALLDEVNSYL